MGYDTRVAQAVSRPGHGAGFVRRGRGAAVDEPGRGRVCQVAGMRRA